MADPTTVERMRLVAEGLRDLRERGEMVFEDEVLMLVEAATRCVEAEREACAKLCEEIVVQFMPIWSDSSKKAAKSAGPRLADMIRARGKES